MINVYLVVNNGTERRGDGPLSTTVLVELIMSKGIRLMVSGEPLTLHFINHSHLKDGSLITVLNAFSIIFPLLWQSIRSIS